MFHKLQNFVEYADTILISRIQMHTTLELEIYFQFLII